MHKKDYYWFFLKRRVLLLVDITIQIVTYKGEWGRTPFHDSTSLKENFDSISLKESAKIYEYRRVKQDSF